MIRPLIQIFGKIMNSIELRKYNEFTIEEYFRKKGYFVGTNNRIYIRNFGCEPFLIRIGNHCTVTSGVRFITHDGGAWVFRHEIPQLNVFGKIEVKDNCFIGIDSIILPNVTIGPNSVVGAGSVVTKDVPPDTVVAGVPARSICSLQEYKEKCLRSWNDLGLSGSHKDWPDQLVARFWQERKADNV